MVKRWHETDDEAIRRAAAQRSGSAWPASVMLPHRGSVSAKQAAQRFSALGGVAAIVAGNAVGDDELDATLHDKVCDLEGRVDGIDQRVDQGAQLIRGLDERVYAIENLDTHGVGAPPAAETSDGYELLDADTSHELAEMATTHPNVRLLLEHNDRIEAQLREAQHALRDTQRALRGTKVGMRAMRHIYATAIQSHARTWLAERATGLTATRCRVIVLQTRARRRAAGSRLVRARRAAVTIAAAWRRFAVIAHMTIGKCLYGKRMLRLECEYLAECLDKAAKREKKLEIEASEAYKREKKLKIEASRNLLPPGSTVALYSRFARCFVQIKDDEATASGTGNRIKLKFDVDVRLRDPNLRQGSYCAERLFVVDAGDGAIALHSAAYNTSGFLSMRAVDVLVSDPRSVDGIKLEQPLCFDALEFGDESRFFAVAVGPNEIALYNVACSKFLAYGDDGHRHSGGRMIPSLMGSPFSTNLVKGWEDPVPCPSHFFIKHASPY